MTRDELHKQVDDWAGKCSEEDWDGEHAMPVKPYTVNEAHILVDLLPEEFLLDDELDVDITPWGTYDFQWLDDKFSCFSILVPGDNKLSYAYLMRGILETTKSGQCPFGERIPQEIKEVMDAWMEKRNAKREDSGREGD